MALSLTRLRRSIVLLSVILAGALVLTIAPAVISADEDEKSIEQFEPITISEDTFFDLEAVAEELDPFTMLMIFMQLEDLGEFDTNFDEDSFYDVGSLNEVSDHLGGDFAHPEYLPAGFTDDNADFGVGEAGYLSVTIDVAVARSISQLLDLPADWLPSPSEQETVTLRLDVPESGFAGWSSGLDVLMVGQIDLPDMDVPENVDLELLRDAIIDDPRMPNELADQLGAIDNWDETVPVPVPEGAEYEDLTIDGNAGFMLSMDGSDHSMPSIHGDVGAMFPMDHEGGIVVWEADGTLHIVAGNLDTDELRDVAESTR